VSGAGEGSGRIRRSCFSRAGARTGAAEVAHCAPRNVGRREGASHRRRLMRGRCRICATACEEAPPHSSGAPGSSLHPPAPAETAAAAAQRAAAGGARPPPPASRARRAPALSPFTLEHHFLPYYACRGGRLPGHAPGKEEDGQRRRTWLFRSSLSLYTPLRSYCGNNRGIKCVQRQPSGRMTRVTSRKKPDDASRRTRCDVTAADGPRPAGGGGRGGRGRLSLLVCACDARVFRAAAPDWACAPIAESPACSLCLSQPRTAQPRPAQLFSRCSQRAV